VFNQRNNNYGTIKLETAQNISISQNTADLGERIAGF